MLDVQLICSVEQVLCCLVRAWACDKVRVFIMGDFNLPGIDWVEEQGKGRADEDFLVLVQDCFLTQFIMVGKP